MEFPFSTKIKVRSYDMDSFGHVNNAIYLNYLEAARCDYMNERGLSFNDFEEWKRYPVVTEVNIQYKAPAKADDILNIKGRMGAWRRARFSIEYEIENETTGKRCATATMFFAFIDENSKLVSVPDAFKNSMD